MNIGIVGGSIAGCTAAYLLSKEGHDVTILERSSQKLVGRGGGIGTTQGLLEQIRADGLIDDNFASFDINKMPLVGKDPASEPYGRVAWSIPMSFVVFRWSELWRYLRKRIPDSQYRYGTEVSNVIPNADGVTMILDNGERMKFDLILFADGYNSMGRRLMFPNRELKYRGYVLWRGLLPEFALERQSRLKDEIQRLSYKDQPGHTVMYFIPGQNGSMTEGQRAFNWAAYIAVDRDDLDHLMKDNRGVTNYGTLPPGRMSDKNERKLKKRLSAQIPSHFAQIIDRSMHTYIQVIYTIDLEEYAKDRMCLIGDAGIVAQPFTGSGVFKGYRNIKQLIQSLKENESLDEALNSWSAKQVEDGKKILALGEQMEKAFIWEQPDFSTMSAEDTERWWKESVSFPDNFSYEG